MWNTEMESFVHLEKICATIRLQTDVRIIKACTHCSSFSYLGKVTLSRSCMELSLWGSADMPTLWRCWIFRPIFRPMAPGTDRKPLNTDWNLSKWLLRLAISSFLCRTIWLSSFIRKSFSWITLIKSFSFSVNCCSDSMSCMLISAQSLM